MFIKYLANMFVFGLNICIKLSRAERDLNCQIGRSRFLTLFSWFILDAATV